MELSKNPFTISIIFARFNSFDNNFIYGKTYGSDASISAFLSDVTASTPLDCATGFIEHFGLHAGTSRAATPFLADSGESTSPLFVHLVICEMGDCSFLG